MDGQLILGLCQERSELCVCVHQAERLDTSTAVHTCDAMFRHL
jgi:hypothetical protein